MGGAFSHLQPEKKRKRGAAEVEEEEEDEVLKKLEAAGVSPGCQLILVDGIRCLNKSDCVLEIKPHADDEDVRLRFQTLQPRSIPAFE
jgi:hypothetical protein